MKKLYIITPMKDKTMDEILAYRRRAADVCRAAIGEDIEVIDSILDLGDKGPIFYLGESIKLMQDADYVWVPGKLYNYRGCQVEYEVVMRYGLNAIFDPCSDMEMDRWMGALEKTKRKMDEMSGKAR